MSAKFAIMQNRRRISQRRLTDEGGYYITRNGQVCRLKKERKSTSLNKLKVYQNSQLKKAGTVPAR